MKNKEIEELLNYIDQFVYVDQTYNDIKLSKIDCKLLLSYIEQLEKDNKDLDKENQMLFESNLRLQTNRDKAIKFMKNNSKISLDDSVSIIKFYKQLKSILESDRNE